MSDSKTTVNNTFKDEATGLAFLIPYHRQLQPQETAEKVRRWVAQQKDDLFKAWKAKRKNQQWQGDERGKKDELFKEYCDLRRSSEILLAECRAADTPSE
jgi:hypothetical protein